MYGLLRQPLTAGFCEAAASRRLDSLVFSPADAFCFYSGKAGAVAFVYSALRREYPEPSFRPACLHAGSRSQARGMPLESPAHPRQDARHSLGLALVIPQCYHSIMKVAISLPDPIFSAAEKLAHRMRVSRSQLYAQAIEEYLGKRQDTLITEQLNALYASEQSPVDPAMTAAQLGAIGHEAW